MKERAREPSHLRPPLDSPTNNSNNHSSHAAMQMKEQSERKGQNFEGTFFQSSVVSYTRSCYYFYDNKKLCTLFPCACMILDHLATSPATILYYTVPSSTEPYPTVQYLSPTRHSTTVHYSSTKQYSPILFFTVTFPTMTYPTEAYLPEQKSFMTSQIRVMVYLSTMRLFTHFSHPPYYSCSCDHDLH